MRGAGAARWDESSETPGPINELVDQIYALLGEVLGFPLPFFLFSSLLLSHEGRGPAAQRTGWEAAAMSALIPGP